MPGISPASKDDIPLIRDLTFRVWPQTYRGLLSEEQIEYMLDMMYSEDSLKKQMDDGARFIIVYDNKEAVGFASYQRMSPDKYKLHKIYVLSDQQGKGIGRFIIDYVMNEIKEKGGRSLHLQVNKNNRAKQFYEKLGFKEIEQIKLDIGRGYFMDDYIMEKPV